jgi:carboxyl-terminal processing protease
MKRAIIEVQSVLGDQRKADSPKEWDFFIDKTNKIAYIRVIGFSENTAADLRKTIVQLQEEGVRGLIIDLRNNPGGLLRSAVEVSDLFLTEGRIVSTKGRNKAEEVYDAKEEGTLLLPAKDFPVAILINKYSASASEIVAAALQDHKRAVIIGERSYGKGSVQNIIELKEPGGATGALKLTTASYWRPSGKNIHRFPDSKETDEWGVKPDEGFKIDMKDEERLQYVIYRRDRDIVHGKPGTQPPPKPKTEKDKDKKPFEDRVLKKALEYLRGKIKEIGKAPDALHLPEVADG